MRQPAADPAILGGNNWSKEKAWPRRLVQARLMVPAGGKVAANYVDLSGQQGGMVGPVHRIYIPPRRPMEITPREPIK